MFMLKRRLTMDIDEQTQWFGLEGTSKGHIVPKSL